MMTALQLGMRHAVTDRIWPSPPVRNRCCSLSYHPEENNASHHERYTTRHRLNVTIEFAFVQNLGQVDNTVANEIILLVVFVEAAYVE
jgi:hypothetical protein